MNSTLQNNIESPSSAVSVGSKELLSICVTVEGTTIQDVWANLLSLVITACKHKQEHGGIWPVKVESTAGNVEITGLTVQASSHTVTDMNTNPTPVVKIKSHVPANVLSALKNRVGQYTDMMSVFHCIQLSECHWVGVAGDGDNGSYEWFSMRSDRFETSDCGYGMTEIALRDVLNKEAM